jgi:hypothetical protein
MGEMAEGMMDGTFCEMCGEYLNPEDEEMYRRPLGVPDYCSKECAKDRGADWWLEWQRDIRKELKK